MKKIFSNSVFNNLRRNRLLEYVFERERRIHLDPVEREMQKSDVAFTHTKEQLKQMREYCTASDKDILAFIKNVRLGQYAKPVEIGIVSDTLAQILKKITGIDTTGNKIILDKEALYHICKRHGINGIADHSMSDINTIARIGYILENYDGVIKGNGTNYVKLANGKAAPTVVFYKKIDGTFYVVEAVTDAKAKCNRVISAYISKDNPCK